MVLADGSTPVTVGETLATAQAAGLRVHPNGVQVSSELDFDVVASNSAPTHWRIALPLTRPQTP